MKKIFTLLFLLLPLSHAYADVTVSLKLDRNEAALLDSISMVVNVSGTGKTPPIELKGVNAFEVVPGGRSSRVEIINGKVNSGTEYNYMLRPRKTGNFKIGPAVVTFKGRTIKSNIAPLAITEPSRSSGLDHGPLFLTGTLPSKKAYIEEQIIYTLKLYRRVTVRDIALSLPQVEHLTFKQLGKPSESEGFYNGKSYHILEVRYALIPSQEGTYGIGGARMNMTLIERKRQSPRGFFNDPFFSMSSGRPVSVSSKPMELKVLSLPEDGRPSDFSGLVGDFNIESSLDPSAVRVGESATLTVRLNGRGNINRIPALKMPSIHNVRLYADQPVLEEAIDLKGIKGSKKMKWALVPEKEGSYMIFPLSISFFDTRNHKYHTIRTIPHTLSALPSGKKEVKNIPAQTKKQNAGDTVKREVEEIGSDILPVHTSMKALNSGKPLTIGALCFSVLLMAPFFVYVLALMGLSYRKKSISSMTEQRAKRAAGVLIRQCRKSDLSSNELIHLIRIYLNDRFGLSFGVLTSNETAEILKSKGAGEKSTQRLQDIIRELEDAVYTGKGEEVFDIIKEIPGLIRRVEKEVR